MKNFFKILSVNILITLIIISLIEIFFGHWFDKNNLGPYVREHRLRKATYIVNYQGKPIEFIYKRNYYAFRGEDVPLQDISAVIMGGSTTDERYKPERYTITEILNQKLSQKNIKIKILNAGIEGQSTRGHLSNLKYWFPRLKDFKPRYIIYYIGINDQYADQELRNEFQDGKILSDSKYERIWDNIKSRSLLYDFARKIKHKYHKSDKKLLYDFDEGIKKYRSSNTKFLSYKEFKNNNDSNTVLTKYKKLINVYISRVDRLHVETTKINAIPIFINQLTAEGFNNPTLVALNLSLINHCKIKEYECIDLASKLDGKFDFWWDGIHTTPEGSQEIANIIAPELIKIINKTNKN